MALVNSDGPVLSKALRSFDNSSSPSFIPISKNQSSDSASAELAVDASTDSASPEYSDPEFDSVFISAFLCFLLIEGFFAPIFSLMDALIFATLGNAKRDQYGRNRMWGTAGFMVFSSISGLALNHMGEIHDSFALRTHLTVVTSGLTCLCLWRVRPLAEEGVEKEGEDVDGEEPEVAGLSKERNQLREKLTTDADDGNPFNVKSSEKSGLKLELATSSSTPSIHRPSDLSLKKQFLSIFTDAKILVFIFSIFVFGCFGGYHDSFYGLFLQKSVGASQVR